MRAAKTSFFFFFSLAGTGTFLYELEGGVHTELQPGSYAFMDSDYALNGVSDARGLFEQALWIHATVSSVAAARDRAVIDVGVKGCDQLCGPPVLMAGGGSFGFGEAPEEGVEYLCGGDEHGILTGPGLEALGLKVGDTVRIRPSHIDPSKSENARDIERSLHPLFFEALTPLFSSSSLFLKQSLPFPSLAPPTSC